MSTNVYEHPTVSWDKARIAFEIIQRKEGELFAAWIELGQQLNLLRGHHPANQDFGAACQAHGIDLTRQHRKAAMWLASLDADQLDTLRQYNPTAIHPATLENRCREQFPEWITSTRSVVHSVDNAETACTSEPEATPVEPKPQESAPEPIPESRAGHNADLPEKLNVRMLLVKKLKEADALVLLNHYPNQQTRQTLGRMGKNQLLALVEKIGSGKFGVVNKGSFQKKVSARVLVPELPKEWTRGRSFEPTENRQINALLADSDHFLAMRDAGCKTMEQCNRWWIDNVLHRKAVDVTINPPHASTQTSESGDAILVHGKVVWPPASFISHPEDYPRDLAVTCFHLWQDLDRQLKVSEPSTLGRGRFIALLATYLSEIDKAAGDLLRQMAFAQQQDISGNLETSRLTRLSGDYNGF